MFQGCMNRFERCPVAPVALILNASTEPYSILPTRLREGKGQIDIESLSFRYADNLPFLYQDFRLKIALGTEGGAHG